MVRGVLEPILTLIFRVLVALIAFMLISSEMAFALSSKEHWEKTKLNLSHLRNLVNTQNCYKSSNHFLGCIEAINSLLASQSPKKTLSNYKTSFIPGMKDIHATFYQDSKGVEKFNFIQIRNYEAPSARKDFTETWSTYLRERNFADQSWKELYITTKTFPISINNILKSAIVSTEKIYFKYKIANSINAYYKTAIDPHTYITPTSLREATQARSESSYIGTGVTIQSFRDRYVLKPLENGPAAVAGIKSLDVLEKVDGYPVLELNLQEIVEKIKGPTNTSVTLSVLRNNKEIDFVVPREKYTIYNVESEMLVDPLTHQKIGYIKISKFSIKGTCHAFIKHAKRLKAQGAKNLILDLRNNLGGLLDEALCIASTYLKKGELILTENNPQTNSVVKKHFARREANIFGLFNNDPLFILQNAASASASEVLAGSLSAYGRAILIGERSHGKGTLQRRDDSVYRSSTITMMKTSARFHFVSGASNQLVGIEPDIEAHINPNPTPDETFALREADYYSNAVVPSQKVPSGFPKHGTDAIKRCINRRNIIPQELVRGTYSSNDLDYQLLMAREAASCLL